MNSALLSQINSGARLKKVPDSLKNDRSGAAAGAVVGKTFATTLCVGLRFCVGESRPSNNNRGPPPPAQSRFPQPPGGGGGGDFLSQLKQRQQRGAPGGGNNAPANRGPPPPPANHR